MQPLPLGAPANSGGIHSDLQAGNKWKRPLIKPYGSQSISSVDRTTMSGKYSRLIFYKSRKPLWTFRRKVSRSMRLRLLKTPTHDEQPYDRKNIFLPKTREGHSAGRCPARCADAGAQSGQPTPTGTTATAAGGLCSHELVLRR